ncbi:hypothetical protein BP00DRAFT_457090 [Aspergillus indologenus CBS 114.80]|uniref:Uncharacterized protein n=1 Tax=Aspergillus indologenus CBS 114.80 TaxID=1450541 RepID=A0A2V5IAX7_9EURO|nr:hypothetical protein BP00DRAFT_457090 [Aspergillus indologenus CBS 114.80]
MPHHCTVCKDTVKLHCLRRGHVTECTELSCKLPYQSSREKDCPYCRNALQKRTAREGSIPNNEDDDAMLESAGGDGDSDKENDSPDGVRAQRQRQRGQQRQQRQPQLQSKKQKKKKGKHVRETRKLKDIRRSRPGKLK